MFVAPIVILGLLGWVIRDQGTPTTRLAVVNEAAGPATRIAPGDRRALAGEGIVRRHVAADEAPPRRRSATAARRRDRPPEDLLAAPGRTARPAVITPGIDPADEAARSRRLPGGAPAGTGRRPASRRSSPRRSTARRAATSSTRSRRRSSASSSYFFVFILTGISFLRERIGGTLERLLATPVAPVRDRHRLQRSGSGCSRRSRSSLILAFALGTLHVPAIGPLPAFSSGSALPIAGSPAPRVPRLAAAGARRRQPRDLPVDLRPDRAPDPPVHPDRHRAAGAAVRRALAGRRRCRTCSSRRRRSCR